MSVWILACLLAAATTQGDEGALAPPGAWVTHGGSPARNRASATPAVRKVPHLAWELEAPGAIEGDPLAWGETVFVAYREEGGRGLAMLDLLDGSVIDSLSFPGAELPLAPCVWDDRLVVRAGELRAYRVVTRGLQELWSVAPRKAFGPPLLYRDEVYVVDGRELVRLAAADGDQVWRVGRGHHGRPSLRGERVYVPGREGELVTIDAVLRDTGEALAHVPPALAPGGQPSGKDPEAAFVAVMEAERVLYLDRSVRWTPTDTTRSLVSSKGQDAPRDGLPTHWLYQHVEAAEVPGGWIGFVTDLWYMSKNDGYVPLASAESHPWLVRRPVAPSRAGRAAYLGATALDLDSSMVLWNLEVEDCEALIPVRDAVLLRRGEHALQAWRARDPIRHSDLAFGTVHRPDDAERIAAARAVLDDGSIEAGDFVVEERKGQTMLVTVRREGAKKDLSRQRLNPLARTELVLGGDDRVIFAAGPTALLRGAEVLIDERLGDDYAALAIEALPSKDYELVAAIVARARDCGVEEKALKRPLRKLESNADEGAAQRRDDVAVPIEAQLATLDRRRQDRLCEMAAALPDDEHDLRFQLLRGALALDAGHGESLDQLELLTPLLRIELLREVEARHPGSPAVAAEVRALLPAELEPAEPFETLEWLAFLEAITYAPVEILDPPQPSADLSPEERRLGNAALNWRPDVKGFKSKNLFIITPVSRPGAIARCLSTGELVCDALDEMFADGEVLRDERYPLFIRLFETKKEYLAQSARDGGHVGLGWTAGHFDFIDNVSRLFLPSDDEAFEEVTRTLVHELAHQWIRNRCPLFTNEEAVQRMHEPPTGGHWVVEGFASLIEEFVFDPASWTWTTANPTSRRRDLASSAAPEQLVPWTAVLGGDAGAFYELDRKPGDGIRLRTRLGRISPASQASLYYAQAQAVCYYLYAAEEGEYRARLFDYLAAYYRGDGAALDVEAAFGLSAEDLGRRSTEFARKSLR